jgi:hypothetical protein
MVEHPRGDDRMIAGERAGDVLGALARADAELVLLDVDRMAAELAPPSPSSCGCARSASRNRARRPCRRAAAEVGALGQREDLARGRRGRGRDGEQVPHQLFFLDHRADALVGQQLDQQRVRHPAVDDVGEADAASTASAQALSLGIMPADAVMLDPLAKLGGGQARDQAGLVVRSSSRPGAAVR